MVQDLADFVADEPIFVDANIFLFHAFDDEEHGKAATSFLVKIENEEIEALTSSLVIDEVFFKFPFRRRLLIWRDQRSGTSSGR